MAFVPAQHIFALSLNSSLWFSKTERHGRDILESDIRNSKYSSDKLFFLENYVELDLNFFLAFSEGYLFSHQINNANCN